MRIYTRRGDGGETDLRGGARVPKDHLRVEVCGAIDELNAWLGVCGAATNHADLRQIVEGVQGVLLDLGSYLARPDAERREKGAPRGPRAEDVEALERRVDALEKEVEPLGRFLLPGGSEAAAAFHVARTVCRRAERWVVRLHREEPLAAAPLGYLNRLSDLLFVMARAENRRAGVADRGWEGPER